ncbi:MAG: hypothetical protein V8Q81_00185 [Christensenellales bacterium]
MLPQLSLHHFRQLFPYQAHEPFVVRHFPELGGVAERGKILGKIALLKYLYAGAAELFRKAYERGIAVQLAALFQRARPCGDGGEGVGGEPFRP